MALVTCSECSNQVSDKADSCPGCGAPVGRSAEAKKPTGLFSKRERVAYSDQEVAVMLSKKKSTNHVLHFLLTLVTLGLWVFVWILVAISNSSENKKTDKMISKGKKV